MLELNLEKTPQPYLKVIKDREGELHATPSVVNLGVNENRNDNRAIPRILDLMKEGIKIGRFLERPAADRK